MSDDYCRAIEAYLCRKNDGHLIRLVGPGFERVLGWSRQGIPVKVVQTGIDRYFERYYRKGPRRRPVRIEFCDADVLDAFDDWRRAVGISVVGPDSEGGPTVEEPAPAPLRNRRSLRAHIDTLLARLTVLRGSDRPSMIADVSLDAAIRDLDALRHDAEHARGDARQAVIDRLGVIGRRLLDEMHLGLPGADRDALEAEALQELEPFRGRMDADAFRRAHDAAVARLVRERARIPDFAF